MTFPTDSTPAGLITTRCEELGPPLASPSFGLPLAFVETLKFEAPLSGGIGVKQFMEPSIDLAPQQVEDSGKVTCEVEIGKPWRKRRLSTAMEAYLWRKPRPRRLPSTIATLLLVLGIVAVVGLAIGLAQAILFAG